MWIVILLVCSAPYAESCSVVTGEQLLTTKERCFEVSILKAHEALKFSGVYQAKPFCQIVPEGVVL